MNMQWRQARRETGIAKFERDCREVVCGVHGGGRWWMAKAYRVPGTQEAGRHAMLLAATNDLYERLREVARRECEERGQGGEGE